MTNCCDWSHIGSERRNERLRGMARRTSHDDWYDGVMAKLRAGGAAPQGQTGHGETAEEGPRSVAGTD